MTTARILRTRTALSVADGRVLDVGKRSRKRRHLTAVADRVTGPVPSGSTRAVGGGSSPRAATSPSVAPRDFEIDGFLRAVASGELDPDLDRLAGVIAERRALLRHASSIALRASLDVGDRVRINHSVRPLYLHGAVGTVAGFAAGSVVVQLDYPIRRFVTGEVRCPAAGLEPLGVDH